MLLCKEGYTMITAETVCSSLARLKLSTPDSEPESETSSILERPGPRKKLRNYEPADALFIDSDVTMGSLPLSHEELLQNQYREEKTRGESSTPVALTGLPDEDSIGPLLLPTSVSPPSSKVAVQAPSVGSPIVGDIFIVPRQQPQKTSQSPVAHLDCSNIPFLADGRHQLWTVPSVSTSPINSDGIVKQHTYQRQDVKQIPVEDCCSNKYFYVDYSKFHRWKELLLGAEFWATVPRVVNAYIQLAFNLMIVGVSV